MSARMVCPDTMNDVPVKPLNTRKAVNIFKSTAAPVAAEHTQSMKIAMLYESLLPIRLFKGPQISDEKPIASKTPALVMLRVSVVVLNSSAISGVAGRRDVLEKVTARVIQLTTKRMIHFRHKGRP
ncbi:unnamed protein product [Aspergillus oryzae]|uniref:Unnamed protein product n=2 Tax=Aspergillus oryzae TaxID=5062 RepID=A0AAN4YNR9_ASPOZ|nr:unnamed protein product [Aspergillus oryzae]GMF94343.1 unnamed protein product [Aspergillus oryzae]GMG15750.1 unnamed protein product [Aspergillus oryzae]GMG30850.1 unnamed protein product [Aspergillus oryzae]GMG50827.1 unnamed protein product [Aspergillus oryzae var. brunneus]